MRTILHKEMHTSDRFVPWWKCYLELLESMQLWGSQRVSYIYILSLSWMIPTECSVNISGSENWVKIQVLFTGNSVLPYKERSLLALPIRNPAIWYFTFGLISRCLKVFPLPSSLFLSSLSALFTSCIFFFYSCPCSKSTWYGFISMQYYIW